jgi:hypothetical protein
MKNPSFNILIKKIGAPSIVIALIIVFLIWFVPSKIIPISWDFRNNLWGPAYLLVHHRSPYNILIIFQSANAVWMPVIIGLLFLIGYLPLQWASNFWILLNLISLCLMVILIARCSHKSIIWILLTIFSLTIFPVTITHFVLGQVSLIICFVLFILAKYRNQLKPVVIGLLLAIAFTKPQLVVLFLPAYLVINYRDKRAKQLLWIISYTIIWIVLFCLSLFIFFPNWIPDFLYNLSINNRWFYPTLYSFLISKSVNIELAIALAITYLVIGISIAVVLTFKLDKFEALLWCLALTPLFCPVVWSWDFVLLYPLIIFLVFETKSIIGSWVIYCGFGICTIALIFMQIFGFKDNQLTFWVPPFLIVNLLLSRTLRGTKILAT